MGLIGRDHNFISQFLKGLKVERGGKKQKRGKTYSVNGIAEVLKYNKKRERWGDLTSGTTKLMAISSREKGRIGDSEDCWRRSLPKFFKFLNGVAARRV